MQGAGYRRLTELEQGTPTLLGLASAIFVAILTPTFVGILTSAFKSATTPAFTAGFGRRCAVNFFLPHGFLYCAIDCRLKAFGL